MVKINFMGDVMLGELLENYRRGLRTLVGKLGIDPFEHVRSVLNEADLNVINLECVLSDSSILEKPFSEILISPESFVRFLVDTRINVVTTANNHALDHGRKAFERTLEILEANGIAVMGYGPSGFFQKAPAITVAGGRKIGFLGYNISNFPEPDRSRVVDRIKSVIAASRQSVDTMVVSMHWGEEYTNIPPNYVIKFGKVLLDAGCDILHGHHSHNIQGVIRDGNRIFAPSLGNFIFDQMVDRNRITAVLRVEIDEGGVMDFHCLPYYMNDRYQPVEAPQYTGYIDEITGYLEECWKDGKSDIYQGRVDASVRKGHQNNRIRMRASMLSHFWNYLPYLGRIAAFKRGNESMYSVIKDEESLEKSSKK